MEFGDDGFRGAFADFRQGDEKAVVPGGDGGGDVGKWKLKGTEGFFDPSPLTVVKSSKKARSRGEQNPMMRGMNDEPCPWASR